MTELIRQMRELADAIRSNNFLPTVRAKMADLADSMGDILTNVESRVSAVETSNANTVASESSRVIAENSRDKREFSRDSAEKSRVGAELSRVSAEDTRVSQENSRKSAESARVTEEGKRVTAETARASAETTRTNAESTRNTNENTRKSQETSRVNAETSRVSAESSRVSQENARASAENTRVGNENTRTSNESSRVSAETVRKSDFDALKARLEAYISAGTTNIGKNYIINPDFESWTRYPNPSEATLTLGDKVRYFADRWCVRGVGSVFVQKNISNNSYLRIVPGGSNTTSSWVHLNQYIYIGQRIMKGRVVTVSFIVNPDKDITFQSVIRETHLSGAREMYKKDFTAKAGVDTLCTMTTNTLDFESDDNHFCVTLFQHGAFASTTGAVRIHSVKLEVGAKATPYAPPSYFENKLLCEQSIQSIGTTTVASAEQVSYFEGSVCTIDANLPTQMYTLGTTKKVWTVGLAELKMHQGGLLADTTKLDKNSLVLDGKFYAIKFTGISPNVNTTDRRPQYANFNNLVLESEIYN